MEKNNFLITELEENPWYFRLMPEKDFKKMVTDIQKNSQHIISPPTIAKINKKYFIVDGHSRIQALKKNGYDKVSCRIENNIKNYNDLRAWSFKLNRHGYSNPLALSDMVNEDLKTMGNDVESVAIFYGVKKEYILSLIKINKLHDNTKAIIQKIITLAGRKYQFLLSQITPTQMAYLSDLEPKKQQDVLNWIFHDVMYGPSNESLISLPSILEIINRIESINTDEKFKKNDHPTSHFTSNTREIPFTCKCGQNYEIDLKAKKIYEYLDLKNVKIKKELVSQYIDSNTFSSKTYNKKQLKKMIEECNQDCEIRVIISREDVNEDWK